MRFSLGIAVGTAALALALPASAGAATFAVDRTDDPAGPGACSLAPNDCSLNQAADKADADPAADLITLGPGEYFVTNGVFLAWPITVTGAGARQTIVRTLGSTVFALNALEPGVSSELADMTLTGARNTGPAYGGGVFTSDTKLTLRRVAIVDNEDGANTETAQLYPGWGGGVYAQDDLTVIDSLIAGNRASVQNNGTFATGAGLRLGGANNVIRNSTITENVAIGSVTTPASGGGISLASGRLLKLENVTLAGNVVSGNSASHGTNLAVDPGGVVTVRNSIFARGQPAGLGNCDRAVISSGGNVDDGFECGFTTADRRGVDPLLGALANNGGPTDTLALGAGSPAIDFAGDCGLATDQRGLPRPLGTCDAGAFEVQLVPPVACKLKVSGTAAGLKARVTCDTAAALSIAGIATIKPRRRKGAHDHPSASRRGKKPKPVRIALAPVTGNAAAGQPVTVRLKLPKRVRAAAKAGKRVSVKLTLTAHTAAGAESTRTAKIAKLKTPPHKKHNSPGR